MPRPGRRLSDRHSLPPPVPDRIGRAQIFDFHIPDKSVMVGRRDFIWDARGAPMPGIYSTTYLAVDRDLNKSHNAAWLQANHPDWIVSGCDHTPTHEYGDVYSQPRHHSISPCARISICRESC